MSNKKKQELVDWDDFVEEVRARLSERRGDWLAICRESDLTYRWIRTFVHSEAGEVKSSYLLRLAKALGMTVKVSLSVPVGTRT